MDAGVIRELLHKANFAVGRMLYADESSLLHHLKIYAVLAYRRARSGYPSHRNGAFDADELKARGFVVLEGLYDADLVERIRAVVKERMEDPESIATRQRPGPDGNQYSWYLMDPATVLPEIAQLLTPDLVSSLENYYRAHVSPRSVKCWRNLHVPPEVYAQREIYSNRYHCDHSRAPGLLKLIYLVDDVTPEDGPFRLQPRPRTQELMRRGWGNRNNYSLPDEMVEDPEQVVVFSAPAGSIIIANTANCLHRASNPGTGHQRDIIQFQLIPAVCPLDPDWFSLPAMTGISPQELGRA